MWNGIMKVLSNEELVNKFYDLVLEANPSQFLEIGAWRADAAVFVSQNLPDCKVYAYEANPYNYNDTKQSLSTFNLEYINKALTNYSGDIQFFLQPGKYIKGNNSVLKKDNPSINYDSVTVPCDTVDSLHYNNTDSYAIWLDAEGHDFEILESAKRVLAQTKVLLVEVESYKYWIDQKLDKDIIELLMSLGFTAVNRDQQYPKQYNILFRK